jgi:hypothetical protein
MKTYLLCLLSLVLLAAACGVTDQAATAPMQRIAYAQLIAPEFRSNRAARQLVDYRLASHAFPGRLGEAGVLPPERLSDRATFASIGGRPVLPTSFAASVRDGYRFAFEGIRCDVQPKILRGIGTLCAGYVYSAVPANATSSQSPAFALFSADDRIHVRADGALPMRDDPIADNTAPSSAAELVGVPTALYEQIAVSDLRQLLAAENTYFTMRTRGYVPPDTLANASNYLDPPTAPLLDAYFAQPQRLGYRFEFAGGTPFPLAGGGDPFGPAFETWSYSAVPIGPGPKGRRSFTMFSGGGIRVANGSRAANGSDPFLSAK